MYKRSNYFKWCIVPQCKTTSFKNPEKEFINVPKNTEARETWMKSMRRNPKDIALKTACFVCEDHFDLEDDMENYVRWKLIGGRKLLKKNAVPHKFDCQLDPKPNITSEEEPICQGEEPLEEPTQNSESEASSTVEQALADVTANMNSLEEHFNVEVKLEIDEPAEFLGQTTSANSDSMEEQLSKKIRLEIDEAASQTANEQLLWDPCEPIRIKEELLNETSSPIDEINPPTEEHPGDQCTINSLDYLSRVLVEENKKDYQDIETLFIDIRLLDATMNRLSAHRSHLTSKLEELCSDQMASQKNVDKQTATPDEINTKVVDKEIAINIKDEVDEIEMEDAEIFPPSLDPEESAIVLQNADEQLIVGTNLGNIYYTKVEDQITFHRKIKVTNCAITAIQLVNNPNHEMYMFVGAMDRVLRMYSFQSGRSLGNIPLEAPARCIDAMWNFVFVGCSNGIYCRLSWKRGKVQFMKMKSREDVLSLKATYKGKREVLIVGQRNTPILILDALTGFLLRQFTNAIVSTVYSIALDGKRFFCGTAHNGILKYTFRVNHLEEVLQTGTKASVTSLKIANNLLFAGCFDGHVYVIGLRTGNIHILKGRPENIASMEIINDKIIVGSVIDPMAIIPIPADIMAEA